MGAPWRLPLPRTVRFVAGVPMRGGAAAGLRRPGERLDDVTRRASRTRSSGDLGGLSTHLDEEPAQPYAPTRLAYELSHIVDGRSARNAGAGVSLPDSARPPAGGAGGVPAALQMTPPGDRSEAQARRFASTGGWGPPGSPGGAVPVSWFQPARGAGRNRGPGTALDGQARRELEPALGGDLGAVRVHTDPAAAASVRALGANAYTVGPDIVFAPGATSQRQARDASCWRTRSRT